MYFKLALILYVAQASLKLTAVFLPQPPKCWNYTHAQLHPAKKNFFQTSFISEHQSSSVPSILSPKFTLLHILPVNVFPDSGCLQPRYHWQCIVFSHFRSPFSPNCLLDGKLHHHPCPLTRFHFFGKWQHRPKLPCHLARAKRHDLAAINAGPLTPQPQLLGNSPETPRPAPVLNPSSLFTALKF